MIYQADKLLLVAGPCSLENEGVSFAVAEALLNLSGKHRNLTIIFKGSFDKANRTSFSGPRGPGLKQGLELLQKVKERFGFPVLTDIHECEEAAAAADICDVLQIPAFLSRQTDLLAAAAKTGKVVNVKKGQFLSAGEMRYVVEKLDRENAEEIWLTERGNTFGYNNLVVDMRNFVIMKDYGHPTIIDATHSVQLPGGLEGKSGGQRQYVPCLAHAALAAGAEGVFVESHPDPAVAISDGPNQIPVKALAGFVESCLMVWETARKTRKFTNLPKS